MSNSYLDIPEQCRGTQRIGGTDYHYERGSAKVGHALYLAAGPDTRDWSKIDAGALDYSVIARQEHDVPGFQDHDGPRIRAACPICNAPEGTDEIAVKSARAAQVSIARQEHSAGQPHRLPDVAAACPICHPTTVQAVDTLGPVPEVEPDEVRQRREQREREAAEAQERARRENELKQRLPSIEPPTESDELARLRAENDRLRGVGLEHAAGGSPQVTGAADPALNAGVPPTDPDVVAGARPEVQAQSLEALGSHVGVSDAPTFHVDAGSIAQPGEVLPEGHGRDPWTGEVVKISRNPGADAEAPYGRKKDNSPRRAPANKKH